MLDKIFEDAAYTGTKKFTQHNAQTANATGFGAAADDYAERGIDLNEQLIMNKPATLFRYLQNMCLLSDGSLVNTHGLLCGVLQQLQTALSMPSAQLLKNVALENIQLQLQVLCLYRTKFGEEEKLINRIFM